MIMRVPPVVGPDVGVMPAISGAGRGSYVNASASADVAPSGFSTSTVTSP
jgi:hypothetical protein